MGSARKRPLQGNRNFAETQGCSSVVYTNPKLQCPPQKKEGKEKSERKEATSLAISLSPAYCPSNGRVIPRATNL